MADNTTLDGMSGGNTVRDIDKGGIHAQVMVIDIGGAGGEDLWTAAVISADNQSAPSAPNVYSFGLYFDGTNWDRIRGDSTQGLLVYPGVAATSLGKAEDAVHSSGDTGVMVLAVRQDEASVLTDADGDYSPLVVGEHGDLDADIQHYKLLDDCDATTGWTVLNDDTANLTTDLNHVFGTASLEFDKVNGSSNTLLAVIQKTVPSFDIHHYNPRRRLDSRYVGELASPPGRAHRINGQWLGHQCCNVSRHRRGL
jgi:hypothetical protein